MIGAVLVRLWGYFTCGSMSMSGHPCIMPGTDGHVQHLCEGGCCAW